MQQINNNRNNAIDQKHDKLAMWKIKTWQTNNINNTTNNL
jgi:hypothetical protein